MRAIRSAAAGGWVVKMRDGLVAMLPWLLAAATAVSPPWTGPCAGQSLWLPEMAEDAGLTDVCFLDADRGWAVGDRGVIWATEDGGRNWRRQASGTDARLESVCFLHGEYGWAAGGRIAPFTHRTSAVLLHTNDGGKHWRQQATPGLPGLKQIRFFDGRKGWACGDASALYPAGLFRTSDGGKGWASIPAEEYGFWIGGEFFSPDRGVVVGQGGKIAVASPTGASPSATTEIPRHAVRSVHFASQLGWAVGDRGLVLRSLDGGQSWAPPAGPLPPASVGFEWRDVAVLGDKVWIAGEPGSVVLHSADAGRTWRLFLTEQALPLSALTFIDADHGWAVGALGTVLATRDGGQSWRVQRQGGQKLALLGIFAESQHLPLPLFCRVAGDEGYLAGCEVLSRADRSALGASADPEERLQGCLSATGASWGGSPSLAVGSFGVQRDVSSPSAWDEYVVRKIRQWRPEVIVTEDARPAENDLRHAVNQLVLSAVEMAADPKAFPQHLTCGLPAWQVKRVYGVLPQGKPGAITITPSQLAPRLGRPLEDVAISGQRLLEDYPRSRSGPVSFRMLANHFPRTAGKSDFFAGMAISPGDGARRKLGRAAAGNLPELRRIAQKRRVVDGLLSRPEEERFGGESWLLQIEDLGRGLEPHSAATLLYELACEYRRRDRPDLAAESLRVLTEQLPGDPLADAAWMWLAPFSSSAEANHRHGRPPVRRRAATLESVGEVVPAVAMVPEAALLPENLAAPDDPDGAGGVGSAAAATTLEDLRREMTPPADGTAPKAAMRTTAPFFESQVRFEQPSPLDSPEVLLAVQHRQRLASWAAMMERRRPELFAEASLRFPFAAGAREVADAATSQRTYQSLIGRTVGAWRECAEGELWLARPSGRPPKPYIDAQAVAQRPRLDGQLDEPFWRTASFAEMRRGDTPPSRLMAAQDGEFLYLAVEAPWLAQPADPEASDGAARPRDANLSDSDRVDVLLDVDRDYATCYRLTVDHRGWTSDACLGDATWNPTWYVASHRTRTGWTIEAAVLLADLVSQAPQAGEAWGLGLQRLQGRGVSQSWTEVAGARLHPAEFGYLRFVDRRPPPADSESPLAVPPEAAR